MIEDMYIHFALDSGCGVTSCTSSGLDFLRTIGCNLESWTRLTLSSHALLPVGQCLSYMHMHACTHMETKRAPSIISLHFSGKPRDLAFTLERC